jgi:GAF domain-containing protein
MSARVAELELSLDARVSQLVQLYHSEGPLFFRDADHDPDARNRAFAEMMEVSSFLGTPLVSKGRSVGILAVDNRVSGRDVRSGDGPLCTRSAADRRSDRERGYTRGRGAEGCPRAAVVERTAALASAIEAQAARVAAGRRPPAERLPVGVSLGCTPLTSVVGFS